LRIGKSLLILEPILRLASFVGV